MTLAAENKPAELVTEDFNVIMYDMGEGIPERICLNDDGSYTVLLNPRYSHERLVDAMEHAFNHVLDEDWSRHDVQEIEFRQHKKEAI